MDKDDVAARVDETGSPLVVDRDSARRPAPMIPREVGVSHPSGDRGLAWDTERAGAPGMLYRMDQWGAPTHPRDEPGSGDAARGPPLPALVRCSKRRNEARSLPSMTGTGFLSVVLARRRPAGSAAS